MSPGTRRASRAKAADRESGSGSKRRGRLSLLISLARTLRTGLAAVGLLAYGSATARAASCDYYASPGGTGNGLSASSPFRISSFWSVTFHRQDTLPSGRDLHRPLQHDPSAVGIERRIGSPDHGAGSERRLVLINGQGGQPPVQLYYNDWFVIEGINACCSNGSVVDLAASANHNVIRPVAAWDAADNNTVIFGVD